MDNHIVILTGLSGSGKTTACREGIALAQRQGLDCAGILCPARFEVGRKTGIDLLDVRTGERHPLAEVDDLPADLRIGPFRFDTQVMSWGKDILNTACPCDLLIVDEIGPLELERGQGWVNALEVLRTGCFGVAVVTLRPSLVETFRNVMKAASLSVLAVPPAGSSLDLWWGRILVPRPSHTSV